MPEQITNQITAMWTSLAGVGSIVILTFRRVWGGTYTKADVDRLIDDKVDPLSDVLTRTVSTLDRVDVTLTDVRVELAGMKNRKRVDD